MSTAATTRRTRRVNKRTNSQTGNPQHLRRLVFFGDFACFSDTGSGVRGPEEKKDRAGVGAGRTAGYIVLACFSLLPVSHSLPNLLEVSPRSRFDARRRALLMRS